MKSRNLLLLAFLLLLSLGLEANDFVSERVFVYPVKSHYLIGDSVEVKGQVLSEDSTFVPHSRYLWLDVIRGTTVIYRQYLRCDASGSFYTRFHVAPTWKAISTIFVHTPVSCRTIHRRVFQWYLYR